MKTTQNLSNPVYYNDDKNLLMVLFESSWDDARTVLESEAFLNLETGKVTSLKQFEEEDINDLDMCDSECIWIGEDNYPIENGECLENENDFKSIKISLTKKTLKEEGISYLVDLLRSGGGISFAASVTLENDVYIKPDLDNNNIDVYSDFEDSRGTPMHCGFYELSEGGLKDALSDADLFPHGPVVAFPNTPTKAIENTNSYPKP